MNQENEKLLKLKVLQIPPKLQNWSVLIKEDSELTEEKENYNNLL